MASENNSKDNQRKYVKYERDHSNSLWHAGWTKYSDNERLIIIEDDASRFIVGFGVYNEETVDNTVETLARAIELYGKPEEILTYGTQLSSSDGNKFRQYLDDNNIKYILGSAGHTQRSGKLKRLNYTVKSLRPYFSTWEEVVYHYNYERMHASLSIDDRPVVTPAMAYEEKGGKLNVKEQ